jgi:protein phosphatase
MAAAGQMAQEEVPAYIPKNVITRSLGPHSTVHVDLEGPYNAAAGDVFLLCSDGLSGPVSDEELGAILQCMEPEEAAETLVDLANLRGGPDNISVIVARVGEDSLPKLPPVESLQDQPPATPRRTQTAPLWIAAGACLGVLAYCLVNEIWPGAIVAAVALAVAFISALVFQANTNANGSAIKPLGGPYGNGPYRKAICPPNGHVVEALQEIAGKLRELPEKQPGERTVDWQPFDTQRSDASSAAKNGDYVGAIRGYSQAIRGIMRQLREHKPMVDPDAQAI